MVNVIKKQAIADFFTALMSGKTKQRFRRLRTAPVIKNVLIDSAYRH